MCHKSIQTSRLTTRVSKKGLKLSHFGSKPKIIEPYFYRLQANEWDNIFQGLLLLQALPFLSGVPTRDPYLDEWRFETFLNSHYENNSESESASRYIVEPPHTSTIDYSKVRSSDFIKILYHLKYLIYVTYRMHDIRHAEGRIVGLNVWKTLFILARCFNDLLWKIGKREIVRLYLQTDSKRSLYDCSFLCYFHLIIYISNILSNVWIFCKIVQIKINRFQIQVN